MPRKSLSDEFAEVPKPRPVRWFDKLPPARQRELLALRVDFYAGRYPGKSLRFVYDWLVNPERGSKQLRGVGRSAFRSWWMDDYRE